jgi:serine/threonine-protein kinase
MTQQLSAAHDSLIGSMLLGRFRVVRELARGGMGVVYLARSEGAVGFVKPVVVKLLLPEHTEDDHIVGLFAREARILSQLRHPSLVDVIEFGVQDGTYVLVLEYVRGYHLGLWRRYLALKKRSVSVELFVQLIIDVLEAVHHAHTQLHPDGSSMQIVHRDVSPSNILLDETGRARLVDFGVARMRGGTHDYRTQVEGSFMGKLQYTAPEVFAGGEASPKSDLYACAVVLHEALYGQNVFHAETQAATLQRVLFHSAPPLEPSVIGATAELDRVLARALAKAPSARHADAEEFALDLRKVLRTSESELRARLAEVLEDDFGAEMAQLLNLESLADRDAAWRRGSVPSPRAHGGNSGKSSPDHPAADGAPRRPRTPAPIGATVVMGARPTLRKVPDAPGVAADIVAEPPANDVTHTVARRADARTSRADRDDDEARTEPQPGAADADADAARTERQPFTGDADEARTEPQPFVADVGASPTEPQPFVGASPAGLDWPSPARLRTLALWASVLLVAAVLGSLLSQRAATPAAPAPSQRPQEAAAAHKPAAFPALHPPPPAASSSTPPSPSAAASDAVDRAAKTTDRPEPGSERPRAGKRATPDAAALTRALRKQQPKLEACFKEHSLSLDGQPTTQLVFDLAQDGTLRHVELSPRTLAATSLGQCLLRVARTTPFPPQPRPVSFVIPLTASTTRGS